MCSKLNNLITKNVLPAILSALVTFQFLWDFPHAPQTTFHFLLFCYIKICCSPHAIPEYSNHKPIRSEEHWSNAPWTEHVKPQGVNGSTEHFTCKSIPGEDAIRFVIYICQNEQHLWDSIKILQNGRRTKINTHFQRLLKTTLQTSRKQRIKNSTKINSLCTLGWNNQTRMITAWCFLHSATLLKKIYFFAILK